LHRDGSASLPVALFESVSLDVVLRFGHRVHLGDFQVSVQNQAIDTSGQIFNIKLICLAVRNWHITHQPPTSCS
jgi:hypothetical protein